MTLRWEETDEQIGDAGWRWTRRRAQAVADHLNAWRGIPTHRYVVQPIKMRSISGAAFPTGRWQIVALQNRARP